MDLFISTFHIDWKIIIAQTINFAIVLFIMYFLVIKPMRKLMDERSSTITKGLDDAKMNAELLSSTKAEYEKVLANARAEAHEIFQNAKKDTEAKRAEMLESAKLDVENLVANGKKALEGEKAKMIEEAKKEVVSLVVRATEKLLQDDANVSLDTKLIEKLSKEKKK